MSTANAAIRARVRDPVCGMACEPTTVSADELNPGLIGMTRRFRFGAISAASILVLTMGGLVPGFGLRVERLARHALSA